MKSSTGLLISFLIQFMFIACSGEKSDEKIKSIIMVEAFNYAAGNLIVKDADTTETGNIIIGDNNKKFVLNPSKIFIGPIDEDDRKDAVVSLNSLEGNVPGPSEHLIFLGSENGYILVRSIESDMRILRLSDRIITAELPKYPRSSPLHNCADCQEIVNYSFKNGDLVRSD